MCNFGRGHHETHFGEIVLNLDQWFGRLSYLKTFLISSSGDPCIKLSKIVCAILVEAIIRCHLKDFLSGALVALVLGGEEPFMQFW